MSKDSDAMDVDPPAQPPSPEPAASSTTPSADTASAETSANGPTPAEKGKGPASGTDADAGPSIVPPSEPPTPVPEKHEEPDAEGQKAQDELLKDVPPPDVTAVLNKDRAPGAHIEASLLSVPQLQALVDKALSLKGEGNKAFTSKPAKLDVARDDYLRALDCLPAVPKHLPPPGPDDPRIREVSDEEADQIELDFLAGPARIRADNSVRDTQKALWGNLGAVYAKQPGKDKETVEACTKALRFDPAYEKALLRRAAANERIGTWSALSSAQKDCLVLTTLLPPGSDSLIPVRKALDTLPAKIKAAKQRETDDVVGKMGDL